MECSCNCKQHLTGSPLAPGLPGAPIPPEAPWQWKLALRNCHLKIASHWLSELSAHYKDWSENFKRNLHCWSLSWFERYYNSQLQHSALPIELSGSVLQNYSITQPRNVPTWFLTLRENKQRFINECNWGCSWYAITSWQLSPLSLPARLIVQIHPYLQDYLGDPKLKWRNK
jgi:hypothetical protein